MIHVKNGNKTSLLLSTNDIFIGTDVNKSLEDKIAEQDKEIAKLKQYTKWYVKYGGMGSGGGSGSSSSTSEFGFKAYISSQDGTFTKEIVNNEATELIGYGTYLFTIDITKSKGHAFEIKYTIDGTTKTIDLSEGITTFEVSYNFTKKTILKFTITDLNTDSESDQIVSTIIPQPYTIDYTIVDSNGTSQLSNKMFIDTFNTSKCVFNINVYEKAKIYLTLKYTIGNETFTHDIVSFENTDNDTTLATSYTIDIPTVILNSEYAGKNVTISICYGESESDIPTIYTKAYELVPIDYWLIINDESNRIYETADVSNTPDNCLIPGSLPFTITLSYGYDAQSQNISLIVYYYDGSDWTVEISEQTRSVNVNTSLYLNNVFNTQVTKSGWYKLHFIYNSNKVIERYFYVTAVSNEWTYADFFENRDNNYSSLYYTNESSPMLSNAIKFYSNSETISTNFLYSKENTKFSFIFNAGIQYDSINKNDIALFKFNIGDESTITIKQNEILYDSTTLVDYYLPLTENSDINDKEKYHLFNLSINYVNSGYEVIVYIDGNIAGFYKKTDSILSNSNFQVTDIIINPDKEALFYLNLFNASMCMVDKFSFGSEAIDSSYKFMTDINAVKYFSNYQSEMGIEISNTTNEFENLLNTYVKFDKHALPYINAENFNDIIFAKDNDNKRIIKCPVIILNKTFSEGESVDDFFSKWLFASWPEDSGTEIPEYNTGMYYIPKTNTVDANDSYENYLVKYNNTQCTFTLEIQGSSTRKYGSKNFELSIVSSSDEELVYTPEFDTDDSMSLLPEKSFTLKCDEVDSSLCNNNSIGKFINENTTPIDSNNCPYRNNPATQKYVKNCLVGVPMLLFLKITDDNKEKIFYLGIYNFNLGRKSYFNLGYYDTIPESFNNLETTNNIQILDIHDSGIKIYDNLKVAEISDGSKYFDFSQYDKSVLFNTTVDENKTLEDNAMFSDTLYGEKSNFENKIQTMVSSVTMAGGYIFDKLKKGKQPIGTFIGGNYEYSGLTYNQANASGVSYNYVPDYHYQYQRYLKDYTLKNEIKTDATEDNFSYCVANEIHDEHGDAIEGFKPIFDLKSLVEYYTICMVFGMVDSVLKNLEIKSWGDTFYTAFYDMDTALGIDNLGNDNVSYFVFSDYWKTNDAENNGNIIPSYATIYTDFFDTQSGINGYDIPTSYLFAIAKYATMSLISSSVKLPTYDGNLDVSPVNFYAKLRSDGNALSSAENFFENYFDERLENIPTSLINLNYRSKYNKVAYYKLSNYTMQYSNYVGTSGSVDLCNLGDFQKFNGNGKYKKREWLRKRLHLLDAYFNLNSEVRYNVKYINNYEDNNLEYVDLLSPNNEKYYYPYLKDNSTFTFSDCEINKTIFSSSDIKSVFNTNGLIVKADEYTPLIYFYQSYSYPYLIGSKNDIGYNLRLESTGNQAFNLFGSRDLTYINDLSYFNLNSMTYDSDKLTAFKFLGGGNNTVKDFTLKTKNIESIEIVSSKYSGDLTLDSDTSFSKLTTIDLSNTSIQTNCSTLTTSLPINSINLKGISSSYIKFINLSYLTEVNISDATINSFEMPMWANNIEIHGENGESNATKNIFYGVSINLLSINNTNNELIDPTVSIYNMDNLTSVNLPGVKKVIISNCKNLKTISFDNHLEELTILTSCTNSSTSTLTCGTSNGVLDFSNYTNLKKLKLTKTKGFTTVKCASDVILDGSAFQECINLQYLDNVNGCNYILNGSAIFNKCYNFTLKDTSNNIAKILVNSGVTSLSSTFSCYDTTKGVIDYDTFKGFINYISTYSKDNIKNITNIDWLFGCQNIEITAITQNLSLSGFTNVTDASYVFYGNKTRYLTKDSIDFGSNSSDGSMTLTETYDSSSIYMYIELDAFSKINSKIKNFNWWNSFFFSKNGNAITTAVLLQDFLSGMTNVVSISGLAYFRNTTIDLKDCFKYNTKLTTLSRFLYSSSNWKNLMYYDDDTEDYVSVFTCLDKLTSISYSLTTNSSLSDEKIYLDKLFTQKQWKQFTTFMAYSSEYTGQFSIKKYFSSRDNYNNFFENTFQNINTSITSWNYIFENCSILNCGEDEPEIKFTKKITNVKTLQHTFYNFKAYVSDTSSDEVPFILQDGLFNYLPNVTTAYYAFSEMYFKNAIPFNFFYTRHENTGTGYVTNIITNEELTLNTDNYVLYYTYTQTNEKPSNEGITSDNIENSDIWVKPTITPAYNKPYVWVLGRNKKDNVISDVELYANYSYYTVDYRYYTYTQKMVEISGIFHDTVFKNPIFNPYSENDTYTPEEKTNWINNNMSYFKIKDTDIDLYLSSGITKFYPTSACSSGSKSYVYSSEIEELISKEVDCGGGARTINGNVFKNFSIYSEKGNYGPFVSPDFFYSCSSSCNIQNAFTNNYSTNNRADGKYTFEGYMPDNLLNVFNSASIKWSNFMKNINVLPFKVYEDEENSKYLFVPHNFIKKNFGNIDYLFNFHIRIPTEDNKIYYILCEDSITKPNNTTSLSETLPVYAYHGSSNNSIMISDGYSLIDVVTNNYNFNYRLICNSTNYDDTYLDSLFTSINYNKLLSYDIIYVLSCQILSNSATIDIFNKNRNTSDKVVIYSLYNNYGSTGDNYYLWRIVNQNFILPKVNGQNVNQYIFNTNIERISYKTLQLTSNEDTNKQYWQNTYNTLTIV